MPCHLSHRAAEVHVDVVDLLDFDQIGNGVAEGPGIGAVELDRAGGLVRGEAGQLACLLVSFDETAGADHLGHVETCPVLAAETPEWGIGDPGHRGEHDGWIDGEGADAKHRSRF